MDSSVVVALISAASIALVAVVGSLAQIFGPAWRESQARRADQLRAQQQDRYSKAAAFIEALLMEPPGQAATSRVMRWHRQVIPAQVAFLSALSKGEGPVADWTADVIERLEWALDVREELVAVVGRELFSYLRGDIEASELRPIVLPPESELARQSMRGLSG